MLISNYFFLLNFQISSLQWVKIMIYRIFLAILLNLALKANAEEEKDSIPAVKIKYMTSRPEVFKGEMITVQCLVTSHEQNWDEITVEINRSVFNR